MDSTDLGSIRLAYLTFVDDGDAVMVGRPDTGDYASFPPDGAEAVRRLRDGDRLDEVADWYQANFGTTLDSEDLRQTLHEIGFVANTEAETAEPGPVHWQRLGRAAFSLPAWLLYVACAVAAAALMVSDPTLRPNYSNVFFTSHLWLIPLALAVAQPPLMILHEGFHALAGRRLGLPSRLGIGRRLFFVVAETRLDALYSVPRRSRYLPFLAGIVCDVVAMSLLVLTARLVVAWNGPGWLRDYALALALSVIIRLLWQLFFFLETDLYYVLATVLGSSNLQDAARFRLNRLFRRICGRPVPDIEGCWSKRDLMLSRWYAPLLFVGAGAVATSVLWVALPAVLRVITILRDRFEDAEAASVDSVIDSVLFLVVGAIQIVAVLLVLVRDKRAARNRNTIEK